ncbi:MAG TPA: orotidine-5'-phosphate decarboxylase [Gammaproteobacteria bacterium]|nr:orotidine-5'-phosphate decarboxylase [Gammaproteobacteria bacterium]
MQEPPVIVALDYPAAAPALELVDRLEPGSCRLKVGKELFTRCGPDLVGQLVERGFEVFLDLKFHDIPNTVARACAAAAELGVWMVNVHASGGRRMLEAAREALESAPHRPLLVAVTVLTSLSEAELHEIGFAGTPADNVKRLAALADESGLDGVVCSPREVAMLREARRPDFRLVTPGIRPAGADRGDQTRVMTPAEALAAGASDLVIGRPITAAPDPMAALAAIEAEIAAVR